MILSWYCPCLCLANAARVKPSGVLVTATLSKKLQYYLSLLGCPPVHFPLCMYGLSMYFSVVGVTTCSRAKYWSI